MNCGGAELMSCGEAYALGKTKGEREGIIEVFPTHDLNPNHFTYHPLGAVVNVWNHTTEKS